MWGFKPDETKSIPKECISKINDFFKIKLLMKNIF